MINLPQKYENVRELVPGQNALVYSAKDTILNRTVFLKGYPVCDDDPGSALREPQMLEKLAHNNLTRIFAADHLENGYLLLSMEMVTGGSFLKIIDDAHKSGVWPSSERVLKLVTDSADGLGHLHRSGFVHRDIKPANLMRRVSGNTEQGVVTDLGLASRLNESGRAYASQHARLYRPPEVWEGHGYCPSSDVYQLGCVLFQLLGGTMPYKLGQALSDDVLGSKIIACKFLDIQTLPPHLPRQFVKLIQKCVCSREARLSTMSDFIVETNNLRANHSSWSFVRKQMQYEIVREDRDGRSHRFTISSSGDAHSISREKKASGGQYRRNGTPVVFTHNNLASSRQFREAIDIK